MPYVGGAQIVQYTQTGVQSIPDPLKWYANQNVVGCTFGTADTVVAACMVEAAAWVACMSDTAVPAVRLFQETPAGLSMLPGLQESVAKEAVGSW